jgi:hypothetical protein
MEEEASYKSSKVPYGFGRDDPVKEYLTDPVKRNIIDPVKRSIEHPSDDDLRKLERGDPLNVEPLNRHDCEYRKGPSHKQSVVRLAQHPFSV